MDKRHGNLVSFKLFSLYFALYHVARTSFVDGATLVLQRKQGEPLPSSD